MLKNEISQQWVEKVLIFEYCRQNALVLPQKNGVTGVAILKIVDVLKKIRGIENVFELLNSERSLIEENLSNEAQ